MVKDHMNMQTSTHLCNTNDHVLNQRLDGPQASDVLSGTVPNSEDDLGRFGGFDLKSAQIRTTTMGSAGNAGRFSGDDDWILSARNREKECCSLRRPPNFPLAQAIAILWIPCHPFPRELVPTSSQLSRFMASSNQIMASASS